MGKLHASKSKWLDRHAVNSNAFKIAKTAHNHVGYKRLKGMPPDKIQKLIEECVKKIHVCEDTKQNIEAALSFIWESWQEVTDYVVLEGKKAGIGVKGYKDLNLELPVDWGNAAAPAKRIGNQWIRPIKVETMGTENLFNANTDDSNDDDSHHYDLTLKHNQHYSWEGEVIQDEDPNEEQWRPEDNTPLF